MSDAEVAQARYDNDVIRICQIIPTVVTLYDHLITLNQEVDLVWNKPWSNSKFLFLWNRYFGCILLLIDVAVFTIKPSSDEFCQTWLQVRIWAMAVVIWSMQLIMLFRTSAFYHRRPVIRTLLLLCFIAQIISICIILTTSLRHLEVHHQPFPGISFCTPYSVARHLYGFFIAIIVFDLILAMFSVWTGIDYLRFRRSVDGMAKGHIWETLLKDNLKYSAITLLTYAFCAVTWVSFPVKWIMLSQSISIASTCVTGIRLILDLREAYYLPWTDFENWNLGRVSVDLNNDWHASCP